MLRPSSWFETAFATGATLGVLTLAVQVLGPSVGSVPSERTPALIVDDGNQQLLEYFVNAAPLEATAPFLVSWSSEPSDSRGRVALVLLEVDLGASPDDANLQGIRSDAARIARTVLFGPPATVTDRVRVQLHARTSDGTYDPDPVGWLELTQEAVANHSIAIGVDELWELAELRGTGRLKLRKSAAR